MQEIPRRWFLAGSVGLAAAALLPGCTSDGGGSASGGPGTAGAGSTGGTGGTGVDAGTAAALAAPGSPGFVDEQAWQARVQRFLASATSKQNPSDATNITAHLIAARRDPAYRWDPSAVTVAGFKDEWDQLEQFAVSDKLAKVFSEPWQTRVRNEAVRKRQEDRWREQLGADYERARTIRAWLAQHPKAREMLAYLYLSQTDARP
jgi:hypothetical protein